MQKKCYPPIIPNYPHFLHGGDYNPEQWIATPEIWEEDMRLMKLAKCNVMSVGIFAWASIEVEEGKFEWDWLDKIMDKLADNNSYAMLATPSGARPTWMAEKYPEVLRVTTDRRRRLYGGRHNHCYTSPVYREKCLIINSKLAERYKNHPALAVWHVSNEYGDDCHCPLCQEAFRDWLKERYGDLDTLNNAWWNRFWSHTFSKWSQIESPSTIGENNPALNLAWKRFVTHQTNDFMKAEIKPLHEITPDIPATTNLMGTYRLLDYWQMAPEMDIISLDNYPKWHGLNSDAEVAAITAFRHDMCRSMKQGKPFILMESTPSTTNWQPISKRKKPGMHLLSSIQAVAHGADTVQYFQWRKSRGCAEKLHGAVVDHVGHEHTRVFEDVAEVGDVLSKLDPIIGSTVHPEVALIYDWENRWVIEGSQGPRNQGIKYLETCERHYAYFWNKGISIDVINMEQNLNNYKLVVAPMLYMVRKGVAEKLSDFVENGGTLVTTYWSGIADEEDLCFLGGFPGPLRKLLGIWSEEIDSLYDNENNYVIPLSQADFELSGKYEARELCDLIHAETATVLAKYEADFYAERPALTVNKAGKGNAYYIASRNDDRFLSDFYDSVIKEAGVSPVLEHDLPEGVTAQSRTNGKERFVFVLNFTPDSKTVNIGPDTCKDLVTGASRNGEVTIPGYGVIILACP